MSIELLHGDCLRLLKQIPDKSVDLVVTDPPYLIKNTKAGGKTNFAKSIQQMNNEIKLAGITEGVPLDFCDEILRVQDKVNAYVWCNKAQIMDYLDFFVKQNGCSFDILCWQKDNAMPTFNNKYLTDKEYCLYFRRGGYCMPNSYEEAKTIFKLPINIKDKKIWKHPTIKPLPIIETLVKNSSKEGDTILDPFMGSGTTGVACKHLNRNFIGMELDFNYYMIASERIKNG